MRATRRKTGKTRYFISSMVHRPGLQLQSRPRCGIFLLRMASRFLRFCFLISTLIAPIGPSERRKTRHPDRIDAARKQFQALCSRCHGADGNGGEMGPPIVTGIVARSDAELMTVIRDGRPANRMPPFGAAVPDSDMTAARRVPPHAAPAARLVDAREDDGGDDRRQDDRRRRAESIARRRAVARRATTASNCSAAPAMRSGSGSANGNARFKPVTSQTDWTTVTDSPAATAIAPSIRSTRRTSRSSRRNGRSPFRMRPASR